MDTLRVLCVIILTLAVLTLLAQGLSYTEIIQENRQSIAIYIKIISMGAPKVLALLLPLALFIACIWSLNRIHKDAEITVVQATGMTNWQLASPVLRLAVCVVAVNLALNLWGQPAAQRELRQSVLEARSNLVTSLIQPGQFTTTGALTFYARKRSGPDLINIFISDARAPDNAVDYIARSGRIVVTENRPAFIMSEVQIHQKDENGALSILYLDQYKYDLAPLASDETDTVYKAPDRYLPELIWPDLTDYINARAHDEYIAEVHYRLSSPLLNIAVVFFALWAILAGQYSKLGYSRRIRAASIGVGVMLLLHIVAHSEAENAAGVNALQWLIPLVAIIALSLRFFKGVPLSPSYYYKRFLAARSRKLSEPPL